MKIPIDPTGVARRKVERVGARAGDELDAVVVEEPLEIRVDGETIGVTMRTPGDDACLALGFLLGEGIIHSLRDVGTVSHCGRPGHEGWGNVIEVRFGPGTSLDADRVLEGRRFVPISSACGVCGRQTIQDLIDRCGVLEGGARIPVEMVQRSVERMRAAQIRFEHTGGIHAAAAFDAAGELVCAHEDVGRHNAVDKVVGDLLRFGLVGGEPKGPAPALLVVSGRAGFEIVQKAAAAGIAIVASVSAPTSLSIDLAESSGLTLIGFARGDSFNIYTHAWRVLGGDGRSRLRALPTVGPGQIGEAEATVEQPEPLPSDEQALVDRIRTACLGEELSLLAEMLPERTAGEKVRWSVASTGRFDVAAGMRSSREHAAWSTGAPALSGQSHTSAAIAFVAELEPQRIEDAELEPLPALDRVVPDAEHGALAIPAEEEARALESRRSLAAELVERTDQMIRRQRIVTHQHQPAFDRSDRLDFDFGLDDAFAPDAAAPGAVAEGTARLPGGSGAEAGAPVLAGDAAALEQPALAAALEQPALEQPALEQPALVGEPAAAQRPGLPAGTYRSGWEPQALEPRAVLIDDRDPENPAPIFWPNGGWSTGHER